MLVAVMSLILIPILKNATLIKIKQFTKNKVYRNRFKR